MCLDCWDADKKAKLLKAGDCDGKLTPFMSMETLRHELFHKWQETLQTEHVIYKDAIINPPNDVYSWVETFGNNQKIKLQVKFI